MFLNFYLSKSLHSKCSTLMANRREGTTLPDWPCDALGRLCIGDKMVHRLTGLWGGTDPDPGVMVDLLVLCGRWIDFQASARFGLKKEKF